MELVELVAVFVREEAESAGQAVAAITQYVVLRGRMAYVLSLTTEDFIAPKYSPTFDKIAQSFRLLAGAP